MYKIHVFKQFGYWWFRLKNVVYGPYHTEADARFARAKKTEPEWKEVL